MFQALLISIALTNPAAASSLESKTLPEIYAAPVESLEGEILARDQSHCANLISAAGAGNKETGGLSPAEFCMLQSYSSTLYEVNRKLWTTPADGSGLDGADWARVRILDAALGKITPAAPALVYRGTSREGLKIPREGEIVRLRGYTSTSPDRDVAAGFIRDRLMVIRTKTARDIKPYSNAGMEAEYLIPRSAHMRVDRIENKMLEIFTEAGPEKRRVEVIYLSEVDQRKK